jgi:AraC-like DNA-binding protein
MTTSTQGEMLVPAFYALQLVQVVKRWHVPAEELLSPLGLSEAMLEEPHARLPASTMRRLFSRGRTLTGEPGIGFHLGLQTRISLYGYAGVAAMSAATLGEAIALAVQFAPVLAPAFALRLWVEGPLAALVLEEREDLGDIRDVLLISGLMGLSQMGPALVGRDIPFSLELAIPEPSYYPRFAHLVPEARFGQPVNQLVFDAAALQMPSGMANRATLRLAREQCERDLEGLGLDGGLAERVLGVLAPDDAVRTVDQVAASMHLSARTLKRRLAAQGVTFSTLLDSHRREKALLLLRSHRLSIDEISDRLGYSTVPNFIRAFRRWTGKTPGAYRRGGT